MYFLRPIFLTCLLVIVISPSPAAATGCYDRPLGGSIWIPDQNGPAVIGTFKDYWGCTYTGEGVKDPSLGCTSYGCAYNGRWTQSGSTMDSVIGTVEYVLNMTH